MKRLLFVLGVMVIAVLARPGEQVRAASYYDQVSDGTVDADGYYLVKADSFDAIRAALSDAAQNASAAKKYKIVLKPQTYKCDLPLQIPGNTYLYATGATLVQEKGVSHNMIYVGGYSSGGYDQENITVEGGTWNENGNSNTAVKVLHAKNFKLIGATVRNTNNSHLMEVAGVNGLTISNCTFADQVLDSGTKSSLTYEAIQLDILVKKHISASIYENLSNKNIKITGCTFRNVPRGVGSHTAVLNDPIRGIRITNNKFSDIKSCAVQLLNVVNCEISHNQITSAPRGITVFSAIYSSQDTYLASTLAAQQGIATSVSDRYQTPAKDMKIVIQNNAITIKGKDAYATYERCGIWVNGQDVAKAYKNGSGDTIPKGNYYMSGVTVSGNTIKGNAHGIKIIDTKKCSISNNKMTFTGKGGSINYYGVAVKIGSQSDKISGNTASGYVNDIFVIDSKATKISKNTVKNAKKYGIAVERGTVSKITGNTVSKTKSNGIHIWDKSKASSITKNTIRSAKGKAVYAGNGSKVSKVSSNKILSCGQGVVIGK